MLKCTEVSFSSVVVVGWRGDQVRPGRPDSRGYVSFLTGDQQFYPGFYSEEENRQKPKKPTTKKKNRNMMF